jgi:hypothetical protein
MLSGELCVVADLKCHLCSRRVAHIEADRLPVPKSVTVRIPGDPHARLVTDWTRLRCPTCGGSVYLDEIVARRQRVELDRDELWAGMRRRRRRSQSNPARSLQAGEAME